MRKILSVLLAVTMVLCSLAPMDVKAAYTTTKPTEEWAKEHGWTPDTAGYVKTVDDVVYHMYYTYSLYDQIIGREPYYQIMTQKSPDAEGKVTVLSEIDGYQVTTIGKDTFRTNTKITECVISPGVEVIRSGAFQYCINLEKVTIGKGIKYIEGMAFYMAEILSEVTFPSGLEYLSRLAFYRNDYTSEGIRELTFLGNAPTLLNDKNGVGMDEIAGAKINVVEGTTGWDKGTWAKENLTVIQAPTEEVTPDVTEEVTPTETEEPVVTPTETEEPIPTVPETPDDMVLVGIRLKEDSIEMHVGESTTLKVNYLYDLPETETTPSETVFPTETEEPIVTPTETEEPVVTPTETEEPIVTPTETEEPVVTPTETEEPAVTPTETEEPIVTPTETEEPIVTPTETEEPIVTPTETEEPAVTPTETESPTPTVTEEATPEVTEQPDPVVTEVKDAARTISEEPLTLVWTSADESVATVNNGTITAVGEGETEVTVSLGEFTDTVKVVVFKELDPPIWKEDVTDVFSDVYDDWYVEYVQYVYDNSLMTGIKGTTRFEPNSNITKAQVAQVLYNMEGAQDGGSDKVFRELKDVYSNDWYADAVAWSYDMGIVTGDINTKKFSPNANVTREQLSLMLFRYAKMKGCDVSATSTLAGLKNAENVSDWAEDGVKWAVGEGLISGIDKNGVKDLAPQGNATRAQVAAILQRFLEK